MRKFYNTESREVITLEDVQKCYLEDCENWNESFNDYLNNCLSKNGSLEEIKPLTKDDKELIDSTANDLDNAFRAFAFAMRNVTEDSFNEHLSADYPFSMSFDEVTFSFSAWIDTVKCAVKWNELSKH